MRVVFYSGGALSWAAAMRTIERRDRKFADGPYAGCQINELTEDGAKLAAVCIELDSKYGAAN